MAEIRQRRERGGLVQNGKRVAREREKKSNTNFFVVDIFGRFHIMVRLLTWSALVFKGGPLLTLIAVQ